MRKFVAASTDQEEKIKSEFSSRLVNLLARNGLISLRSSKRVDAQSLANIAGCSVAMARRYINGEALPKKSIVDKIALWGKVDPYWLYCGEESNKRKNEPDKLLWLDIFIKLEPYIAAKEPSSVPYLRIIEHAFDIYDTISKLDSTLEEKSSMITLMVKSMEIGSK